MVHKSVSEYGRRFRNREARIEDGKIITEANITDNLTSTSKTDALSANQGRVLNEKIQELIEKVELLESKMS